MLGLVLTWDFSGIMYVNKTDISLYVQLFCSTLKTLFPYIHIMSLTLYANLYASFSVMINEPWEVVIQMSHALCSLFFSAHLQVVCHFINICVLLEEASLLREVRCKKL